MSVRIYETMVPMSDGVCLYTRVLLPGDGQYPTVFQRTPYAARTPITDATVRETEENAFIRHGYAVVFQHCRGRGGCEGVCIPYATAERSDGLETLAWIRTLPHYDGALYFSGGSYTASVLLMMLDAPIPDLKAISLSVQTESLYHRNYFNGMCRSFCGFSWWLSMIAPDYPKIAQDQEIYRRPYRDMMARAVGRDLPAFTEELLHDRFDAFWQNDPRIGVMEKLQVPILMTGGWFDYYCYGMCSMWEKLPPETRARSCFLMTPCGHDLRVHEDGDYPLIHGDLPPDREALWFDSVRLNQPFPYVAPGIFRYYMIGADRWFDAETPYAIVPQEALYLSADGKLTGGSPLAGQRSYVYDPDTPLHHDRYDYMYLAYPENRYADVLSFVSDPFTEETSCFGPVVFRVRVRSDCDDTAFLFRLYLTEEGQSYNLVDGATTLLHADPHYRAGETLLLNVISQPTAFHVKRGCRLRLDVFSRSDCYVPHANTAEPFAMAEETKVAHNTVFCGESAVLLPKIKEPPCGA